MLHYKKPLSRSSHTTTKTAQRLSYLPFTSQDSSQLQQLFQQFYIRKTIFTPFKKKLAVVVCKGFYPCNHLHLKTFVYASKKTM